LTSLNLSVNQLCGIDPYTGKGTYDATGIEAITAALSGGSLGLTSLNLRYNPLGEEGEKVVRDAVEGRSGIKLYV